jgi:hypothetical protein
MTHADSSLRLLGRSRDTGSTRVAPPPTPILPATRVELRVWGETRTDAQTAAHKADTAPSARHWHVADTAATVGGLCPIRRRDPLALAQGADYGWAWAVYRVYEQAASGR